MQVLGELTADSESIFVIIHVGFEASFGSGRHGTRA